MVWRTIPLLESLAQSLILALLPVSTLFLVDGSPMESKERFVASGSGVGDRHGRCECLPEINQRSVHHLNDSVHGPAELEGKSTKSSGWDSNAWNGGRLPQGQFERELQEIDRM